MITLEDIIFGTRVMGVYDLKVGAIIGLSKLYPNAVVVEFDNGSCGSYHLAALSLYQEQTEEFKALKTEVNDKIRDALILIQEADALVKAQNKSLTDKDKSNPDQYDFDTASLLETIGNIGLDDGKDKLGK